MTRRVLFEMDHTSLSIYKKLCHLNCDLKQTSFYLLTQKFVGYVITGQQITFATLKNSNVISLFQWKTVASPLHVLGSQCFERIPIPYILSEQNTIRRSSYTENVSLVY